MKKKSQYGYNERLFSSGWRKQLHLARFRWLSHAVTKLGCPQDRVLELGCFDGKVLEFLPKKPDRYLGLDADWENGLELARKRWKASPNAEFRKCCDPKDLESYAERFDLAICMDTLEHIPAEMVTPYLRQLSRVTRGYLFITVPNEQGVVFCCKYLLKKLLRGDTQSYTVSEFINQTLGRTEKVARYEHKGFNYIKLMREVSKFFTLREVSGYPFSALPPSLNFGVGIIGQSTEPEV